MQEYDHAGNIIARNNDGSIPPTHPGPKHKTKEVSGGKFHDSSHSPASSVTDDETKSMTDSCSSSLGNNQSCGSSLRVNKVSDGDNPSVSSSQHGSEDQDELTPIGRGSANSTCARSTASRGSLMEDESIYLDDMKPRDSGRSGDDRSYYGADDRSHYAGDDRSYYGDDRSHYARDDRSHYTRDDRSHYSRDDRSHYTRDDRSHYTRDDRSHYTRDDRSHYTRDDASHHGGDDYSHYGDDCSQYGGSQYGGEDRSYYSGRPRHSSSGSSRNAAYESGSASVSAIDHDGGYGSRGGSRYSSTRSSSGYDRDREPDSAAAAGAIDKSDHFDQYHKPTYSSRSRYRRSSAAPAYASGSASVSAMDSYYDRHDEGASVGGGSVYSRHCDDGASVYSSRSSRYHRSSAAPAYASGSASVSAASAASATDDYYDRHDDEASIGGSVYSRYDYGVYSSYDYDDGASVAGSVYSRHDYDDGASVGVAGASVYSRRDYDDDASVGGGSVYSRRDYDDDAASVGGGSVYSRRSSRYDSYDRHDRYSHGDRDDLARSESYLNYDPGHEHYGDSRYDSHRRSGYSSRSRYSSSHSGYDRGYDRDRHRYSSSRGYRRSHTSSRYSSRDYYDRDRGGDSMSRTDTYYSTRRASTSHAEGDPAPLQSSRPPRRSSNTKRSSRSSRKRGGSTANVPKENLKPAPGTEAGPVYLEVSNGVKARFRKSEETKKAVETDFYAETYCWGCKVKPLFYTADLAYILCPACTCISPVVPSNKNIKTEGVGIALTEETLYSMKCEIASEGGRVSVDC